MLILAIQMSSTAGGTPACSGSIGLDRYAQVDLILPTFLLPDEQPGEQQPSNVT